MAASMAATKEISLVDETAVYSELEWAGCSVYEWAVQWAGLMAVL
jgi:hypothetical protein